MIPYARQQIEPGDVEAVMAALRGEWLTCGPAVAAFEHAFAEAVGAREAVVVNSGTAALHCAVEALQLPPGSEVILPPLTFVASANAIVYAGLTPVFADVLLETGLLDPASVSARLTTRTGAVLAVDYAGQPCDVGALRTVSGGLPVISDACHALGGSLQGRPVGALADLSTFSFHPAKAITTFEGGMITTDRSDWAKRMRIFRNHGLDTDAREREAKESWSYRLENIGYNYRLSDVQCVLGKAQLQHLVGWRERREYLSRRYEERLAALPQYRALPVQAGVISGRHLFPIRVAPGSDGSVRDRLFREFRRQGVRVNVHYAPVHLQPYYRRRGSQPGDCPHAEQLGRELLSLPMFPGLTEGEQDFVLGILEGFEV